MKKLLKFSIPVILVFSFAVSCDKDEGPSGSCKLTSAWTELRFEYDNKGRLKGFDQPWSNCREKLIYDDQNRLAKREMVCPNSEGESIEFSYDDPTKVVGNFKSPWLGNATVEMFYGSDKKLDSLVKYLVNGKEHYRIYFYYKDQNLSRSLFIENTMRKEILNTQYDEGLNPVSLIQQSANTIGFESWSNYILYHVTPADVSKNNVTSYTYLQYYLQKDGTHTNEETWNYSKTYEYKIDFPYPILETEHVHPGTEPIAYTYGGC